MTEEQRRVLGILAVGGSVVRREDAAAVLVTEKIVPDDYGLEEGVPMGWPGLLVARALFEALAAEALVEPEGPETVNGKTVYRLTPAGRALLEAGS